jgi:hypothetical protein
MDLTRVIRPLAVGVVAIGVTCVMAIQLDLLGPVVPNVGVPLLLAAIAAVTAAVLLQRPVLVTTGAGLLLLTYALTLIGRSSSGVEMTTVGVVAGGIFLVAELGWWMVDLRTPVHEELGAIWRQAGRYGLAAIGVGLLAELALQVSRVQPGRGVEFSVIGIAALGGIIALAARLAANGALPSAENERALYPAGGAAQTPVAPRTRRGPYRLSAAWMWLVGSPLAPQRPRSRQALIAQTGLAILLLVLDAAVVLAVVASSSSYPKPLTSRTVFSANLSPAVEAGIVIAGAVVVSWLLRLLVYLASPSFPMTPTARPARSRGTELSELELIRDACRGASESGPLTGDLRRLLVTISSVLAGDPGSWSVADGSGHTSGNLGGTDSEADPPWISPRSDGKVRRPGGQWLGLEWASPQARSVGAVVSELEAMADD